MGSNGRLIPAPCYTLQVYDEVNVLFCYGHAFGQVVILKECVLHFKEELELGRFITLPGRIGGFNRHIATQLQFAEPGKDLSNAKTLLLRTNTCFHFLNIIEVVEFRVRQRFDLGHAFKRRFPTVERCFQAGIVQSRIGKII